MGDETFADEPSAACVAASHMQTAKAVYLCTQNQHSTVLYFTFVPCSCTFSM